MLAVGLDFSCDLLRDRCPTEAWSPAHKSNNPRLKGGRGGVGNRVPGAKSATIITYIGCDQPEITRDMSEIRNGRRRSEGQYVELSSMQTECAQGTIREGQSARDSPWGSVVTGWMQPAALTGAPERFTTMRQVMEMSLAGNMLYQQRRTKSSLVQPAAGCRPTGRLGNTAVGYR